MKLQPFPHRLKRVGIIYGRPMFDINHIWTILYIIKYEYVYFDANKGEIKQYDVYYRHEVSEYEACKATDTKNLNDAVPRLDAEMIISISKRQEVHRSLEITLKQTDEWLAKDEYGHIVNCDRCRHCGKTKVSKFI